MIIEEMKKIWRPGMLLVLLVLGFIFYTIRMEFYISYFPNGPYDRGLFTMCRQMVETYGTSLSKEGYEEVKASQKDVRAAADAYVKDYVIGKKYGLKTYREFAEFEQKTYEEVTGKNAADQNEKYMDMMRMKNYLESEETGNILGQLQAVHYVPEAYETVQKYKNDLQTVYGDTMTAEELEHVSDNYFGQTQMWQNILPYDVVEAVGSYAGSLLVWMCLAVCILLSPLLVHDRMSRMQALQYSSRRGRRIYGSQLAAVMISAGLLTTINLVVFGGLFAAHGTSAFFSCRMYSFLSWQVFCWPNWTHGGWCLMLVLMCYLVSFGMAGVVFFLSQGCANYITMLLKILPIFVASAVICPKMMEYAFYFNNELYRWSGLPYVEILCAAGSFVLGMVLCGIGRRAVYKKNT